MSFSIPTSDDVARADATSADDKIQALERRLDRETARGRIEAEELRRALRDKDKAIASAGGLVAELARQQHAAMATPAWRIANLFQKVTARVPRSLARGVRKAVKAAWWAATPWRIPERMAFLRQQKAAASGVLDLSNDRTLVDIARLPREQVLWPRQAPEAIVDRWSAVRFCLDLLRHRPDLRARFPKALSQPHESGFESWLVSPDGPRLSSAALALVQTVLHDDVSGRARQAFMHRVDIRNVLPHGLTPPGQIALFRWFMQYARSELGLRSEEIVWLFLQASEDPALELNRAYRFTPEWQALHPDAMTVFGIQTFARWFEARYEPAAGDWIAAAPSAIHNPAARQIRQAYAARPEWQRLHPDALQDVNAARVFVDWLQNGCIGSPEAARPTDAARAWCARLDAAATAQELAAGGLNVIGHFCCPSGLRVSAESLIDGLQRVGVPTSLRDLKTDISDEPNHVRFDGLEDFDVTLIHTQPEPFFPIAYDQCDLAERSPRTYRIAYWYWEFDSIPRSWIALTAGADEVWAATEFVAKGLRETLSIPVRTVFPGVRLGDYVQRDRSHFGIEEGTFTFLFNFHMNSVMERKNPLGLIKAFKRAFRADEPVTLVIKTMFGHRHPANMAALHEAAAGARIQVIDATYTADETLSLTDACDAYVSLHRSEGLGLTMAEAMLMGKPVIATAFSGNVDFMDDGNSLLVPYERVRLGRSLPPYDADLTWAEPSLAHAAAMMRRVVDEPAWAAALGERARESAKEAFSLEAAGRRVAHRLEEIRAARRPTKTREELI